MKKYLTWEELAALGGKWHWIWRRRGLLKFPETGAVYKYSQLDRRAKYLFTAKPIYANNLDENTDRCILCGFQTTNQEPLIVLHMIGKHWDNQKVRKMFRNRSEQFKQEIRRMFPHIDFDKE